MIPGDTPAVLLEQLPGLAGRLPWLSLGHFPTPVQPVTGLPFELWLKREELGGGGPLLPGGNKVRKLEPLLGAALATGAESVVTSGATGSSHLLATARYAAWAGLRATCVVGPQPDSPEVRARFAALQRTGAELVRSPTLALGPALAAALALVRPRCRWIEPGGSGPRGVLGHLVAGLELAGQVRAGLLPQPRALFVAAGSGGTLAGLQCGLRLGGLGTTSVFGVRVVPWPALSVALVEQEWRAACRLLGRLDPVGAPRLPRPRPGEVRLLEGQLGAGYGAPTAAAERARALLATHCDLLLDPTYTAKAFAGLLAWRATAGPAGVGPLLFWNTWDPHAR